jgi:O-antigen/teichoic acid export membrane protein
LSERASTHRIVRGTVVRSTGEVIAKLASIAFYVAIARELGEASFGVFFFGLSLSQVVLMAAGLGTEELITREIAKDKRNYDALFPQVITVKGLLLVVLWLATGAIVLAAGYGGESALAIMAVGAAVAIEYQTRTLHAVFQGRERQQYIATSLIVQRIATAVAGIAIVLAGGGLLAASAVFLAGSVLGLAVSYALLYGRLGRARGGIDTSRWRSILRVSAPLGLVTVLYLALIRFDATLLGFLADDTEVGEYGAAYRLIDATMFLSWSFGGAITPWFSRHTGAGAAAVSLGRGFELGLKAIVSVVVPIALVYVLFAPELIELLYGDGFSGSDSVLQLLGAVTVLFAVNFFVQVVLIARNRPGDFIKAAAIVIPVNVALNLVLIPEYGADGAAAGALVSGVLLAALTVPPVARSLGGISYPAAITAPLLAGTAMVAASLGLAEVTAWPLAAIGGGLAYAGVFLLAERMFQPEDFRLYTSLIPKLGRTPGAQAPGREAYGD